jgi:protein tyrosine phosphatase
MVFEYNVVDIFCLTRPQENGKCMAFVYWKNTEPESSAEYSVKIKSKVEDPYWVKKEIELENKITKQKKTINHFYVELWEDDKVPAKNEHIDHLISLASYCEESLSANTTSPAVVHCSAGVGRTGVFICMVELIAYLKQLNAADNIPKTISVFDMVRSLREQRWGSVKSFVVHSSDLGSIQIHL